MSQSRPAISPGRKTRAYCVRVSSVSLGGVIIIPEWTRSTRWPRHQIEGRGPKVRNSALTLLMLGSLVSELACSMIEIPISAVSHDVNGERVRNARTPQAVTRPNLRGRLEVSRGFGTKSVKCDLRREDGTSRLHDWSVNSERLRIGQWTHTHHNRPSGQPAIGIIIRVGRGDNWADFGLILLSS